MRIKEATVATPTDLGGATISNRDTRRRRLMQALTIPLSEGEFTLGDHVTVLEPGTGQAERCQVEGWAKPYDDGSERVVRLTFPAIIDGSNLRRAVQFRKSDGGSLPAYTPRQHVLDRLQELEVQFFCGPKSTHYCVVKAAGAELPAPIYTGTRERTYTWFARIYEPAHSPGTLTQLWARLCVHVPHDEDACRFETDWGVDDSRIGDAGGFRRAGLADEETETGWDFIPAGSNQNGVRPVVFWPEAFVYSLGWIGDRWRWIQDRRMFVNGTTGQPIERNHTLPWGTHGQGDGVLCFPGLTGSHGDQLRDDSIAAWIATPYPPMGIGSDWYAKRTAFGPLGDLPRPIKPHEHTNRRTLDQLRTSIEAESWAAARLTSGVGYYHWNTLGIGTTGQDGQMLWQSPRFDSTGSNGSWNKNPCFVAATYGVPDYGLFVMRHLKVNPWPHFFVEVDGSLMTGQNHNDLILDKGAPGMWAGNPSQGYGHGKTMAANVPPWRTSEQANCILTAATSPLPHIFNDQAHYENGWLFMAPVLFGDRGLRRQAESLAYTNLWGTWQANSYIPQGNLGQSRGWNRGGAMWAFATYVFGRDEAFTERAIEAMYDWRYAPATSSIDTNFPGRIFSSLAIQQRLGTGGVTRVELWGPPQGFEGHYVRAGQEDSIGALSWKALARMIRSVDSDKADDFDAMGDGLARDTVNACPRTYDSKGRILWTFLRPNSVPTGAVPNPPGVIYEPAAAAHLADGGTRRLTQAEMSNNNWTRCQNAGGFTTGECPDCNAGFMRLGNPGAGTGAFSEGAMTVLADMGAASSDPMLTRLLPDVFSGLLSNATNTSMPVARSLLDNSRWSGAAHGRVTFRSTALRTTIPRTAGISNSRINLSVMWGVFLVDDNRPFSLDRGGGAVTNYIIGSEPIGGRWTDIKAFPWASTNAIAVLDGADATLTRTSYRFLRATEETAASGPWTPVSFSFSDGLSREVTGFAWDTNVSAWFLLARRANETSTWSLPFGGGLALPDTRVVIDVDGALHIDVSEDGQLMAVASPSRIDAYKVSQTGGYWGSPRTTLSPDGDSSVSFTRHARMDEALRLVHHGIGGVVRETEV